MSLSAYVLTNDIPGMLTYFQSPSWDPTKINETAEISGHNLTPLYIAFHMNHTQMVIELLQKGADVSLFPKDLPPPILLVLKHKNTTLLTYLATNHPTIFEKPINHCENMLSYVAQTGDVEAVKIIVHCLQAQYKKNKNATNREYERKEYDSDLEKQAKITSSSSANKDQDDEAPPVSASLSPIRAAVRSGSLEIFDIILAYEILLQDNQQERLPLPRVLKEISSDTGNSLIHEAILYNQLDILERLLELGCDPFIVNQDYITPGILAIKQCSVSIGPLETLITICPQVVDTPTPTGISLLHYAIIFGDELPVRCLVANKAKINFLSPPPITLVPDIAIQYQQQQQQQQQQTPLATAIQCRSSAMIDILLQLGADIELGLVKDNVVLTPLTYAVALTSSETESSMLEIIKKLLEYKANPTTELEPLSDFILQQNQLQQQQHQQQQQQHTRQLSQDMASLHSNSEIRKIQSRTGSPLHLASAKGLLDTVKILLEHGALVNVIDINRMTPLSMAVRNGHENVVKVLLEHGAIVTHRHSDGSNVFDYAKLIKNQTIENMLQGSLEKKE